MRIIETIAEMREARRKLQGLVGFVPTMGYLHEGHLALVRRAKTENDHVVVSLFVNPTQFGPQEDFRRYPRDIPRDLNLLKGGGADLVFLPSVEEMYLAGFSTYVEEERLAKRLEGDSRPTHFRGVTTGVAKLFNIIEPSKAYFGQKDAQQVRVVEKMVEDLNIKVAIVVVPTVREADGLAMSSRNAYLNTEERRAATILWKSLCLAEELWAEGERGADRVREEMTKLIESEPLASIDYVSIADARSLEELKEIQPPALVSLAVKVGAVRLIDNVTLS